VKNQFYHKALIGKLFRPEYIVNRNPGAGNNWAKAYFKETGHEFC
jgi:hypothetical protein